MDTEQRQPGSAKPAYRTERIIASLVMAWILVLTSYMIFQDRALSEASMYFLKILLSLSGAVMLATLPGFFDIGYNVSGLTIRAAGGAAAFVFIFTQSPHIPNLKSTVTPYSAQPSPSPAPAGGRNSSTYDRDSTPVLFALSLDPFSIAPALAALSGGESTAAVPGGGGQNEAQDQGGGAIPAQSQTSLLAGAGSTVSTVVIAVQTAAIQVGHQAVVVLERVAAKLRAAVTWIGDKATNLVGALHSMTSTPAADLKTFVATLPDQAAGLLDTAAGPATGAINAALAGQPLPVIAGLGETVRHVPHLLTTTVDNTAAVVGDVGKLVKGVLRSPKNAVAQTGEALGHIGGRLVNITDDVIESARGLTKSVNAHVSGITDTLNAVAPGLVSQIDPGLRDLDMRGPNLRNALADVTSALPPLSQTSALPPLSAFDSVTTKLKLPLGAEGDAGDPVHERGEIRGGCGSCLLQPLDLGGASRSGGGIAGVGGLLGGTLSGLGLGGGQNTGGSGVGGTGGGGSGGDLGGSGGGGPAGAIASTVGAVGSTVRGLTGGLRGRR